MNLAPKYGILGGMVLLLALADLVVIFHQVHSPEGGFAIIGWLLVPSQATLLAWWVIFARMGLASRIAGLLLGAAVLALVSFRFHLNSSSAPAAVVIVACSLGSHLGLSLFGFWLGKRQFGLRLMDQGRAIPDPPIGVQFRLWDMFAWTAAAAVVALLARYALEGCDWQTGFGDYHYIVAFSLLLGFPALLSSPCATIVLWIDRLEPQLRADIADLYYVAVCTAELISLATIFATNSTSGDLAIGLIICGYGLLVLNFLQLLPITFVFWLVRMSDYRLARLKK